MKSAAAIKLNEVTKAYGEHESDSPALEQISLAFSDAEFTAIVGKSGSGKSTLLNMISGIDRPSSGEILQGNNLLHEMSEKALTLWRGRTIGIVFQFFQLIPTLTVRENVLLPMDFCKIIPTSKRKQRADELLERMGVSSYANTLPAHLSGGEQQRVAIARALSNNPLFVVADEPTGNLDSHNAEEVIKLFKELKTGGKGIVMVTHSTELAQEADRIITIQDGKIKRISGEVITERSAADNPGSNNSIPGKPLVGKPVT